VPGHLFVVPADLTQLACSAVFLPTDGELRVSNSWRPFLGLPELLPDEMVHGGAKPPGLDPPPGWCSSTWSMPFPTKSSPEVWLCPTAGRGAPALVAALEEWVRDRAVTKPHHRSRHLLAVNLIGTGHGGARNRRGAAVKELVPALRGIVKKHDVDVVLAVPDARDRSAAQALRADEDWSGLAPALLTTAERLSHLAGMSRLVPFIGSGVGRGAGLPTWRELLARVAEGTDIDLKALAEFPAPDAAQILKNALGEQYVERVIAQVAATKYTLAHTLIADLRAPLVITTNYDECYERAVETVDPTSPSRLVPQGADRIGGGALLKLHGSTLDPTTIVLTRQDYVRHSTELLPLSSVAQAAMVSQHLLFIGYSIDDDDVSRLARQARGLPGVTSSVGTYLALERGSLRSTLWKDCLEVADLGADGTAEEAARLLELLLDRVAWLLHRSLGGDEWLLDERYSDLLDEDPSLTKLAEQLRALADVVGEDHRDRPAHRRVAMMLRELGYRHPDDHPLWTAFLRTVVQADQGATWSGAHEVQDPPGTAPWMILTACNPAVVQVQGQSNAARNVDLAAELVRRGYTPAPCSGRGVDGTWPAEDSFAVTGMRRRDAVDLGSSFLQVGIFELTDDELLVVSCEDGEVKGRTPRRQVPI